MTMDSTSFRRLCLVGSLLCAGCLSESEVTESAHPAPHNTTRGTPPSAPIDEWIIRRVRPTEIAIISPQRRSAEYHRVQAGETLSAIAARYRTTVEQLARDNGLGDPAHLPVGEWLCVPKEHH